MNTGCFHVLATTIPILVDGDTGYGNFNNFYGLCFSLLELSPHHKVGFFEIGTNNFGEIKFLSNLVKPSEVFITNIQSTHLENFQTKNNIAREKADIFLSLIHI